MAFDFNPITGNLDLVDSPAGYINGVVDDPTQLPVTIGTPPLDAVYLSKGASGLWLISRRPAGLYCRVANDGDADDWTYLGAFPEVNSSANWSLYDGTTPSKELKFNLASISTGTTRTLTVPNASGRIQVEGQPIGNVTASTGAFTTLSASSTISPANATASPPTTLTQASGIQWSSLGGTFSNTASIYGSYAGTPTLGIGVGASAGSTTEIAAFNLNGITFNRALTANNGTLAASAPVLDLAQTWNNAAVAFTGLRLNVTNTASVGTSYLQEWQEGGVTQAAIRTGGFLYLRSGRIASPVGVNWAESAAFLYNAQSRINSTSLLIGSGSSGAGPLGVTLATEGNVEHVLALRNALNPQTLRIYGQITGTDVSATGNYERGFMRWSAAGGVFQIGTEKGSGGGTARALEFQTDGVTRLTIATDGQASFSSNVTANNYVLQAGGALVWAARFRLLSDADGRLRLSNNAQTDFDRLQFGGTTSSFPALKRSSTTLQVRLADDTGFAPLACGALTINGNLDASTRDIVTDTTTGTKIGTGTTQKIGFFNATPAVQPAAVADATDAASTQARLNDLLARLRTLGLIAT
jgi:hypothetical protein